MAQDRPRKRGRGFAQAGGILSGRIRQGAHSRGFAEARLLTQWEAIVGPEIARIALPGKVSYAKSGMGATLTVSASGSNAPVVAMQADAIRQRVNACYGYNAISRVRIDQSTWVPQGVAEAQAPYTADKPDKPDPAPKVTMGIADVNDEGLRDALARLAGTVLVSGSNRNTR